MSSLLRRSFLKLAAAVTGGVVITKYLEPMELLDDEAKDWIEERNGFYIVRVPDFKTFSNETLDKPTIFLLGQEAVVRDLEIFGYANIFAPKYGTLTNCMFNASKVQTETQRPIVLIGDGTKMYLGGCIFTGNSTTTAGISLPGSDVQVTRPRPMLVSKS